MQEEMCENISFYLQQAMKIRKSRDHLSQILDLIAIECGKPTKNAYF
jgi:hypothetical protein